MSWLTSRLCEPAPMSSFWDLLFELVTARYEHGSIILTSNTSFTQWGNLLGDEVLATALLDRLLHHAEVIPINGRSYRMKERQAGFSAPSEEK